MITILLQYFKRQTEFMAHEMIWIWLRRENLNKETESLLIATQNHATRINIKCRFCGYSDETANYIKSLCSELAQNESNRQDWMGKSIHWDLCKKLKFLLTDKWYKHNKLEYFIENEIYKMRCVKFSGILRWKRISKSRPKEKKKLTILWILSVEDSESERKWEFMDLAR